jgi:hypothetical protein
MTLDLTAQIIARTRPAIDEALEQLNNGWTDHEVLVVAHDAWAVIRDLKDQQAARDELAGLVCARCDQLIVGTPVRDPGQVAWLGRNADVWCSDTCLSDDAEAYWTARWSA